MRFFNTAGPIQTDIHYYLPPIERINHDEIFDLIAQRKYFILHAPRQTGKTSCLLALTEAQLCSRSWFDYHRQTASHRQHHLP